MYANIRSMVKSGIIVVQFVWHDALKRNKSKKLLYFYIYDESMAPTSFDCLQKCLMLKKLNFFDLLHVTCNLLTTK